VLVDGDAMFNRRGRPHAGGRGASLPTHPHTPLAASRPGPRLVDALEWLFSAVHGVPEAAPHRFPCEWLPPSSSLPRDEASAAAGGSPEEEAAAEQKAIADIEEAHACAVRAGKRSRCETPDPHTAPVGTRSCCTPVPVA